MNIKHTLFVCTSCTGLWQKGQQVGESGGKKLLGHLLKLAQEGQFPPGFTIEGVNCMNACRRSCTVSLVAEGKYSYLFGDLSSREDAKAILHCAHQYYAHADGLLPPQTRHKLLRSSLIARIPPVKP